MLLTNFKPDRTGKKPLYLQIADFIKEQIRLGLVTPGMRLPSVRDLSAALHLSRTTTETCYSRLTAEGYLVSKPQSGYFVADLQVPKQLPRELPSGSTRPAARYDFANNYVDGTAFPSIIWRRHIGQALKEKAALTGYGEPQGEPALREALADYSHRARGVVCAADQIVISAGVQSLFVILAALLQDRLFHTAPQIAWERPGFPQGEEIFRRQGWDIARFDTETLDTVQARLLYVSPSNPYKGRSLTPDLRRRLLRWTLERDGYILEDDYNGEFRYFTTPVSSLQGMGDGEHIVYLGSFSRLLFPSLRISYMVLPPALLARYEETVSFYACSVSSFEQYALALFINRGYYERHLFRLLKHYRRLRAAILDEIRHSAVLSDIAEVADFGVGTHFLMTVRTDLSEREILSRATAKSLRFHFFHPLNQRPPAGCVQIIINFASIDAANVHAVFERLAAIF